MPTYTRKNADTATIRTIISGITYSHAASTGASAVSHRAETDGIKHTVAHTINAVHAPYQQRLAFIPSVSARCEIALAPKYVNLKPEGADFGGGKKKSPTLQSYNTSSQNYLSPPTCSCGTLDTTLVVPARGILCKVRNFLAAEFFIFMIHGNRIVWTSPLSRLC